MPNNILIATPGGDKSIATHDVGGVHHQLAKVIYGPNGQAIPVSDTTPLPIDQSSSGPLPESIFQFLDANGDGSGNININGNYSGGATVFKIAPAADEVYRITRLIIHVEDTSGMSAAKYGNMAALSVGMKLQVHNTGGLILDITNGNPIKTNAAWAGRCFDADLKTWGAGDEVLPVRWTFEKAGYPLRLVGANSEDLRIVAEDDLTGLVMHTFFANGYKEVV